MEKNILVTGGAGYFGYSIINEVGKKYPEARIIIYDNFSKGKIEGIISLKKKIKDLVTIPWENGDIRDNDNFKKVIEKYKPETVIHLAAIVDTFATNREGKDRECEIVNYESAVNVAKIAKECGVKNFIYISSVSIYKRGENLIEEAEKGSSLTYGKTKEIAEIEILKLSDESFRVVALRPATLVGYNPCFRYETMVNLMCIRSINKIPINIFSNAITGEKTYLSIKDAARADRMKGDYFNVSSFNSNLDRVMKLLKEFVKEDFQYNIVEDNRMNNLVYTINSDKIKNLGFVPKETIEETIDETIKGLEKVREFYWEF